MTIKSQTQLGFMPSFFHETQDSLFTDKQLCCPFHFFFIIVSIKSRKDRLLLNSINGLRKDFNNTYPSLEQQVHFFCMSADTPETLRKTRYLELSFFEILSNSDNRFFQNLSALRTFDKFNIKASEPIRYSYLFDSQRKILVRWDPGFLPSPLDLFENL